MANKKYEVYVNVLNIKPPEQAINDFNYIIDEAINFILEGGESKYENKEN